MVLAQNSPTRLHEDPELHTVNTELSDRVEELDRAKSDLQNLFESTDVATVFVDKNLVIRSLPLRLPTSSVFGQATAGGQSPTSQAGSVWSTFPRTLPRCLLATAHLSDGSKATIARSNILCSWLPIELATSKSRTSLARAEARQRLLIAELQHRTRNMLTVVQFLAKQTLGKGGSLDSFVARLTALGRVQGLAGGAIDAPIELEDLVRLEVQAIGAPADGKVTFSEPRVRLFYSLTHPLALALHELATNAVKYGALKEEAGRLNISRDIRDDIADTEIKGNIPDTPLLILNWRESGVAAPTPARSDFGRELIERALAFTLRAKT